MGRLTQVVLLGFCVFWGCDRSDELYPGAPIISLKKLQGNSGAFRYMIVSEEPIPYDVQGTLAIRKEGVYLYDSIMIDTLDDKEHLSVKEVQD